MRKKILLLCMQGRIAIEKAKGEKFWTCTANPLLLILMDLEWKIKDEVPYRGSGCVCERQGKVYPFRRTVWLPWHIGCITMILSKSRTWQKCTHAHTHCHHTLKRQDMSAFSQFWISLHLTNGILLINTKIPRSQGKLKCTVRKEVEPGQCE